MNSDKIGAFLKNLRLSKKMSQYDLAELMHVDHSKINRLENSKRLPNIDDLIQYSIIFNISLDELVSCEKIDRRNKKQIQNTFFKYLQIQNDKFKRLRLVCIALMLFLVVAFIGLITLYFFQNYNTIKVYTFYGASSNYEITNGLLFLSKEKMYFQIGDITPTVENVKIFTEINGQKKLIYEGDYHVLLQDTYGYDNFILYEEFIHNSQKILVNINNEEIPLTFIESVTNDNFLYIKENAIGNINSDKVDEIPIKIKKEFKCDENNNCTLIKENKILIYSSGFFFVNTNVENYTYDLKSGFLSYSNCQNGINFEVKDNQLNCIKGNCENSKKIYDEFYSDYVEKYLI